MENFLGLGQFHLKPQYKMFQVPSEEISITDTPMPDYIVQNIKARQNDKEMENNCISNAREQSTSEASHQSSALSRALDVIKNNKITFNPQLHIFNVEGTNGAVRVVTLHPKETCSCPANGMCYHIMAAKLSLGIKEIHKPKESRNFTKLYKAGKGKGKKGSKSGRKRPQIGDEEVYIGDGEEVYIRDEDDYDVVTCPTDNNSFAKYSFLGMSTTLYT